MHAAHGRCRSRSQPGCKAKPCKVARRDCNAYGHDRRRPRAPSRPGPGYPGIRPGDGPLRQPGGGGQRRAGPRGRAVRRARAGHGGTNVLNMCEGADRVEGGTGVARQPVGSSRRNVRSVRRCCTWAHVRVLGTKSASRKRACNGDGADQGGSSCLREAGHILTATGASHSPYARAPVDVPGRV